MQTNFLNSEIKSLFPAVPGSFHFACAASGDPTSWNTDCRRHSFFHEFSAALYCFHPCFLNIHSFIDGLVIYFSSHKRPYHRSGSAAGISDIERAVFYTIISIINMEGLQCSCLKTECRHHSLSVLLSLRQFIFSHLFPRPLQVQQRWP